MADMEMMKVDDVIEQIKNETLPIGTMFDGNRLISEGTGPGIVRISFTGNRTRYTEDAKTNLYYPRGGSLGGRTKELGTKKVYDPNTGVTKEEDIYISFDATLEYQGDHFFHIVTVIRDKYCNDDKKLPFEYYNEGIMYLTGRGLPLDRNKAIESFRQGAAINHPLSVQMLNKLNANPNASLTELGLHDASVAPAPALSAEQAEEKAKAQEQEQEALKILNSGTMSAVEICKIAYKYWIGVGYGENRILGNIPIATKLYTKAAEMGYCMAMRNLGHIYRNQKDYEKAFYWYGKAIEQNDCPAMYALAFHYRDGDGVQIDYNKAEELLNQAIQHYTEPTDNDDKDGIVVKAIKGDLKNLAKLSGKKKGLFG